MGLPIPGHPSIERPDEHEAGAAGEFYCWINADRECNATCPAFDARCLTNDTVNPCMLLNNVRAVAALLERFVRGTATKPMPAPPTVPTGGKL